MSSPLTTPTVAARGLRVNSAPTPTAESDVPGSRTEIVSHVQRINAALVAWDQWDANRLLPEDLRRQLQEPPLSASTLRVLRRMLLRQLGSLPLAG